MKNESDSVSQWTPSALAKSVSSEEIVLGDVSRSSSGMCLSNSEELLRQLRRTKPMSLSSWQSSCCRCRAPEISEAPNKQSLT